MKNAALLSKDFTHISARNSVMSVTLLDWFRGNETRVEALLTGIEAQFAALNHYEHHFHHCAECEVCKRVETLIRKIRDSASEILTLLQNGLEEREPQEVMYTAALAIVESQRSYIDQLHDCTGLI